MKTIIVLSISIFLVFNCSAQQDTCLTKAQIIKTAKKVVELQEADTLNKLKIQSLEYQLELTTKAQNETEFQFKLAKQETEIYKNAVSNFTGIEFGKDPNKHKVNDNKVLWFAIGVGTGILILYTGAKIVRSI